jgi:hypothetical protein
MFGSLCALGLLVLMTITKDAGYGIAAGLFELSGVIYAVTRPKRLTTKEASSNEVSGK